MSMWNREIIFIWLDEVTLSSFTSQLKTRHLPHWPPSISQHCRFPFVRKAMIISSGQSCTFQVLAFPIWGSNQCHKVNVDVSVSRSETTSKTTTRSLSLGLVIRQNEPNILSVTVKTVLCFGCDVTLQMFLLFSCEKWKHQGTMLSTFTFFASYGKKVANVAHWHSVRDIHINIYICIYIYKS